VPRFTGVKDSRRTRTLQASYTALARAAAAGTEPRSPLPVESASPLPVKITSISRSASRKVADGVNRATCGCDFTAVVLQFLVQGPTGGLLDAAFNLVALSVGVHQAHGVHCGPRVFDLPLSVGRNGDFGVSAM
jgi:hypothetical protein